MIAGRLPEWIRRRCHYADSALLRLAPSGQHPLCEIDPFFEFRNAVIARFDRLQALLHDSQVLTKFGNFLG